ncbi:MAG TPA: hypothetical protein VFG25_07920 [Nitrosopumilaceae archaeon]|nr:hypothetical protein [Nitrosopumilaceae archaeon]
MAISKENKEYVESLIHYYISEASSYEQIAEGFVPEIESVVDTAFGIITGNIYSEFMQAYLNQKTDVSVEDIQEFYSIIKQRAPLIKKAIMEGTSSATEEHEILK